MIATRRSYGARARSAGGDVRDLAVDDDEVEAPLVEVHRHGQLLAVLFDDARRAAVGFGFGGGVLDREADVVGEVLRRRRVAPAARRGRGRGRRDRARGVVVVVIAAACSTDDEKGGDEATGEDPRTRHGWLLRGRGRRARRPGGSR